MNAESSIIKSIEGRAIPLPGNDIDTDRIIPARFLRCVTFDGLGEQVFRDERFGADGSPKPHPFNDERYAGATILLVGRNFGCGSSREHAPQAIMRYGIRAIIGESFAEIFAGNCTSIGVPVGTLDEVTMQELLTKAQDDPGTVFTFDIDRQTVTVDGRQIAVEMSSAARAAFLAGTWNTLDELLGNEAAIEAVHRRLPSFRVASP